MRETRVLLLRHAETSAPDMFHGAESDVGLGEWGFHQAEIVAAELAAFHPHALYCSALRRAVATAEPIGRACGLVPQILESLHERKMGPLSGVPRAAGLAAYEEAKRRWMAGELDHTHEGGESYNDVRRRALPAFKALAARHPGETIVVVGHGMVVRVVLTSLLDGYAPADFDRIEIDNCAINDLRHADGRWRAFALNQSSTEIKGADGRQRYRY